MFESWPLMLKQGVFCQWHSHVRHLLRVTYWHSYDYYAGSVECWGTVGIRPNHLLAANLTLFKNWRSCAPRRRVFSLSDIYVHVRNRTQVASFNRDCDMITQVSDDKTVTTPPASSRHIWETNGVHTCLYPERLDQTNEQPYSNQRGQIMPTI